MQQEAERFLNAGNDPPICRRAQSLSLGSQYVMPISRYIVVGEEGGVALSFGEAGLAQCRKEPLLVRCSAEWADSIQLETEN